MLPELHQSSELHQSVGELHKFHGQSETRHNRCENVKDPIAARKVQKADREKLRRDRLNEQFAELGNALDPDRPKNDKATILGDTIQILRDLTAEVKRLKSEQTSLVEESRDITQEKNELREEKGKLKADIDLLESQFQQRVRTVFSWASMDPTMMMGSPHLPYSMAIPHPGSTAVADLHPTPPQGHVQTPMMASPFIPVPVPSGNIPMHPSLHAYSFIGNGNNDGSSPYLVFPPFPPPVSSRSHVERPSAQYPSPVQPLPGCLVQLQSTQGNRPSSARSQGTIVISHSIGPQISSQGPSEGLECQQESMAMASNVSHGHLVNNTLSSSSNHSGSRSDYSDIMHTDLQLKTPGSFPTSPHHQSNHSIHTSEEQQQVQEASSEIKEEKSSPCHRNLFPPS